MSKASESERGVDVAKRYHEIRKLVVAHFHSSKTQAWLRACARSGKRARLLEADDLVQDVACAILAKNTSKSAFDPTRGSFGKYVHQVMFSVLTHAVDRMDREAPLADPAQWSTFAASPEPAAESEALDATELRSLAKELKRDRATGQRRLFSLEVEAPRLRSAA